MRVQLLGTGAAEGWPNPWCACVSCRAAAAAGTIRRQTSALIDGRLLLEAGGEAARAALHHGATLSDVDAVLVTHDHPDHHHAPVWAWRGRASIRRPLQLVAPPAVLATATPTLDASVTAVPAEAGGELRIAGYDVRVLPASHGGVGLGPPVLYDITGPGGSRLLWATDTGPLTPAALAQCEGRSYNLVLLELTAAGGPGHLDLSTWPVQIAALRRAGAVTRDTLLAAIHLGHGNPPPAELDRVLRSWGAWAPHDGAVVDLGDQPIAPSSSAGGRRVLVLGGVRSGKSAYAEQRLASEPQVTYLATAADRPGDTEWSARVAAHRARRPPAWTTVETLDVAGALRDQAGPLLIDDLGLWLTGILDGADGWAGAGEASTAACDALVSAWAGFAGRAVLVAPEVGNGVVPATPAGRLFQDLMGRLTARLAAASDEVIQVVAGLPRVLR